MMTFKKIIDWVFRVFRKPKPNYEKALKEIQGPHDCALRALHIACPDISVESMRESFGLCCGDWPYKGVTNKEFNISINHLKAKDRFQYNDDDNITLKNLLRNKKSIFIALIYGHFTVVYNGRIIDGYTHYDSDQKVYCYWHLVNGA